MDSEKSARVTHYRTIRKVNCGADKFVLVGLRKIHYVEAGKGPPMVLVPGSYNTYRIWNRLMPLLVEDSRLLALDYLGEFDYTVREQADLIAQIVRQLELGKVNLMGCAQGGAVVFDFATRYPELAGKIVSIGGHLIPPDEIRDKAKNPQSTTGSLHGHEEATVFKSPFLYLYGTKTNKELLLPKNLEFLQKRLPQAWIVSLEGGIFETALKNPQEVASLIQDFLKAKD